MPSTPILPRHHFFVEPEAIQTPVMHFSPDQAHQISRVLRLISGDSVVVLDGRGAEFDVTLHVEGRAVDGLISGPSWRCREPSLHVVIYQAIIRPEHMTWLLQKGTEVGVSSFVPLVSARTQHGGAASLSPARAARLHAVLREAAEQSRRLLIPVLGPAMSFAEALHSVTRDRNAMGVLLWENEAAPRFSQTLSGQIGGTAIHLLVGPEGGWAPEEVSGAREAGLQVLSLGPRLLRAETAALIAATGAFTLSGDLL